MKHNLDAKSDDCVGLKRGPLASREVMELGTQSGPRAWGGQSPGGDLRPWSHWEGLGEPPPWSRESWPGFPPARLGSPRSRAWGAAAPRPGSRQGREGRGLPGRGQDGAAAGQAHSRAPWAGWSLKIHRHNSGHTSRGRSGRGPEAEPLDQVLTVNSKEDPATSAGSGGRTGPAFSSCGRNWFPGARRLGTITA